MEEDSIYRLETKIENLINNYMKMKEENERLKKEKAELENTRQLIEEKLTRLLMKIEEIEKEI